MIGKLIKKTRLLFSYLTGHKRQVAAAVIEKDGRILIAKRKIGSTLGGKWEFPGGKIEPGETPEQCLKRELEEEFNIETEIGELFSSSIFRYCLIPIELLAYKVKYISGNFQINDHEEIKWVTKDELNQYNFLKADLPIADKLLSF